MKTLLWAGILSASALPVSAAAADWTPLLKSMQNGCEMDTEALPFRKAQLGKLKPMYRVSVASAADGQTADGDTQAVRLTLKNAAAFGQPLQSVYVEQGLEHGLVELKFAEQADVRQIVPAFAAKTDARHGLLRAGKNRHFCTRRDGMLYEYSASADGWRVVQSGGGWTQFLHSPKERTLLCLRAGEYGDETDCP